MCAPCWAGLLVAHGCSGRRRARPPARLGVLTSFVAAPRSPPVPSGPSGALHTSGAWSLIGSWARRLVIRPGPAAAHRHRDHAPPPPTGTAARPSGALRRPPHQWGLVCCWLARRVISKPGQVSPPPTGTATMPRHRPRTPQPGPLASYVPSGPSGPSGTLHTRLTNLARNSPTTLSNLEIRSLELQRFRTLLKLHPIELRAS